MRVKHITTFGDLRRGADNEESAPIASEDEAERLIAYLKGLGFVVTTSADVLSAIEAIPDEEELATHQCVEGIAISHASDGWWLLLPFGSLDSEPQSRRGAEASSSRSGDDAC